MMSFYQHILVGCCLRVLSATWGQFQAKPGTISYDGSKFFTAGECFSRWLQWSHMYCRVMKGATIPYNVTWSGERLPHDTHRPWPHWPEEITQGVYAGNSAYNRVKDHIHREKNICRELRLGGSTEWAFFTGSAGPLLRPEYSQQRESSYCKYRPSERRRTRKVIWGSLS